MDFLLTSSLLRFIIISLLPTGSTPIYSLLVPDPRGKKKPLLLSVFSLTLATVSFFCSHSNSILFHPVFSEVELMSLRSLILIFKWMMKKATACWSIGQPWLYWQCPLWLQSRLWKCNPLLVLLVSRSSAGRGEMELSFVSFKASTHDIINLLIHAQRRTQAIILNFQSQSFKSVSNLDLNWTVLLKTDYSRLQVSLWLHCYFATVMHSYFLVSLLYLSYMITSVHFILWNVSVLISVTCKISFNINPGQTQFMAGKLVCICFCIYRLYRFIFVGCEINRGLLCADII